MAKQTFTTGQVLTAAQMTSLQQTAMGGGSATAKTASYVLVAADAGTTVAMNAAGATTITVNTSLFAAGDTVFIQNLGAGVCTITAGTATVNTYSSLALNQYEGGYLYFTSASAAIFYKSDGAVSASSGLTKIVTANFSASASVQIDQCFTSSYVNYIIVLNALGNSGGGAMYMQWQTGTNTLVSTSDYFGAGWSAKNDSTSTVYANNSDTKFTIAPTVASNTRQNFTINISNVGNSSQDANISSLGNGSGNGIATYAGIINAAATYTGVRFTANGNLTGTYTVYGLAK
jgi:hypothetical protein